MTLLTVLNRGPGARSINNLQKRPVVIKPNERKSFETDAFTASLLLKEQVVNPRRYEIEISVEERVAMEQELSASRFQASPLNKLALGDAVSQANPMPPEPNPASPAQEDLPPPRTEKRFVTDPKTVDDGFEERGRKRRPRNRPKRPTSDE